MIVIGVDVHKRAVTAVAVDEAGRMLDEKTVLVGSDQLVGWAAALGDQRLWAVEDCRQHLPHTGGALCCDPSRPGPRASQGGLAPWRDAAHDMAPATT